MLGWASLVALVNNLPAVQETGVRSLDQEDPLEEGMATHSSILAWRIPWTRGAWWATVHGVAESQTRLRDRAHHWSEWKMLTFLDSWPVSLTSILTSYLMESMLCRCYPVISLNDHWGCTMISLSSDEETEAHRNWVTCLRVHAYGARSWSPSPLLDNPLTWPISLSCLFPSLKAWPLISTRTCSSATCKHTFQE